MVALEASRNADARFPETSDPLAPGPGPGKRTDPTGALVTRRWKACGDELMKQRRDYWQNLAMFLGEQWTWWDSQRNILQAFPQAWSPLGKGRARTVTNRIRPNLLSLMGRMLRNDLEFDVLPTDSGDDVVSGAMLAEDVLSSAHHDLDWRHIRYSENFAKFLGGTSAVCIEWDSSSGTPLSQDAMTNKITGTGEIALSAMSINEFGVQPGVRDASKAHWWVQGLTYSPQVVKQMYGLNWLPLADAATLMSPLQQRLLEHMGRGSASNAQLTLVLVMYERPNPQSPKGQYAIVVNGITVHEGPWPFPNKKKLNLFVFHQQQLDSTWIGTTLMNDAVPIQVSYNFMRSCIAEHAKKVGNARLMASQGAFLEEDLTDDPGSVLFYSPDLGGGIPQYLRPPDLPRWMVGEAGDLKSELDDVMFVHDTSRGQASFDRASGQALALLAEKDDSPLGLMAFEEAQRWSEIGTYALELYETKVTETRVVQVTPRIGQSGEQRVSRWNGKRLRGQTRCVVPLETTMPVSQAAQQAFAKDLWDRGLVKDPVVFARMSQLPQRELIAVIDADVARAQRENSRMMQGEAPQPELFDDHGKHIAEHNRFRKSDSYTFADQKTREIVDNHIKFHEQMAAEQLGQQTQRAMLNPAVAALPQADEPIGSMVPPDYAEQQAGVGQVGASVQAAQGAGGGAPPPAGGAPPQGPEGSPAVAAGMPGPAPAGP